MAERSEAKSAKRRFASNIKIKDILWNSSGKPIGHFTRRG